MADNQRLKLIFAGTPEFAAHHLAGILEADQHDVIAVYSQPDRPAGRGKKLKPSPVKALALEHNIPVYQPLSLKNEEAQQELTALNADLMVVVAYGLLLPQPVLDAPRRGCINVHASLLPRWRGAAPIQRCIEAGDRETGVTIMQMDIGLDTGDMLLKAHCQISDDDNAASLHDKLVALGIPALNQALSDFAADTIVAEQQDDSLTCYAPKISKDEALINWHEPAELIARKIRAFNPFPVAYSELNGERIKIQRVDIAADVTGRPGTIVSADRKGIVVACGEGSLSLQTLQLPGGKALAVDAVMNARAAIFSEGSQFGA
jgi:methionyl-tRNA formyltransferase